MALLGSFTCVSNIKMGIGLTAGSAAVMSVISQQLTTGEIKPGIVILDTVFTTFISRWKTKTVFRMSEWLKGTEIPLARLLVYEGLMQLISEGIGGELYSVALASEEKGSAALMKMLEQVPEPAQTGFGPSF